MEQRIVFTCGIPGSGKSTYVQRFVNDHPHFRVFSYDAIRAALGDINDQTNNAEIRYVVRQAALNAVARGTSIIVDGTHVEEELFWWGYNLARTYGIPFEFHVLHTPSKIAKQRNAQRERQVPDDVIDDLLSRMCELDFTVYQRMPGFEVIEITQ